MTAPYVVDPGCLATGCTRPQAPGSRLCTADTQTLGEWIAQIGDEYTALDARPSMQAPTAGSIHGGGLKSHRSVGDLDVMVLRDRRSAERAPDDTDGNRSRGVLEVLGYWAAAVRLERNLTPPTRQIVIRLRDERPTGPLCEAMARAFRARATPCRHGSCQAAVVLHTLPADPTVASERQLLARQLPWIVVQDAAGQFFDDLRTVWDLLRHANGHDNPDTRVPCPSCGGPARLQRGKTMCACGTAASGLAVLRKAAA